jgi:hypothetical protein
LWKSLRGKALQALKALEALRDVFTWTQLSGGDRVRQDTQRLQRL